MTHQALRNFLFVSTVLGCAAGLTLQGFALTQESKKPSPKPNPDFLMPKMTGKWVMRGTIGGDKVTHDVTVDRILNRQYVRIHEIAREKDPTGQPAYEAWIHIAWDKANEEFVVMWLDNTGVTNFSADGVGHGKPVGDRIPFIWKLADGSGIHNTFAYDRASNSWSWKIDNLEKSGKSSPFGRVTLKRK
ncbi:hypothetical protein MCEMSE15_02856 [Fimbriimonadaceae bacterium]